MKTTPKWRWLGVLAVATMCLVAAGALAEDPGGDTEDWIEPPWIEEPDETVPGEETEDGTEFTVPFFAEASTFLAQFMDCETGIAIDVVGIKTEYYFLKGAEPPYAVKDLERIIVWAEGYQPKIIDEFDVMEIPLFIMTLSIIIPRDGIICLAPSGGDVSPWFDEDEDEPAELPAPTPATPHDPSPCGAQESERKVYRVVYHPKGADVERLTKPNGGLETRFTFHFDREQFYKARDRGPCTLDAGHAGAHSPWTWSAWRKDGSVTTRVSFTKTIGGWPQGMSSSYFERWILAASFQDLAQLGLSHLRYVLGSFDPKEYYETYIKNQLK